MFKLLRKNSLIYYQTRCIDLRPPFQKKDIPQEMWDRYLNHKNTVQLFTTDDCSLCIPVKETINAAHERYKNFEYQQIDITDPKWKDKYYERYRYSIPVVLINDVEYCRGGMPDPDDFFDIVCQF